MSKPNGNPAPAPNPRPRPDPGPPPYPPPPYPPPLPPSKPNGRRNAVTPEEVQAYHHMSGKSPALNPHPQTFTSLDDGRYVPKPKPWSPPRPPRPDAPNSSALSDSTIRAAGAASQTQGNSNIVKNQPLHAHERENSVQESLNNKTSLIKLLEEHCRTLSKTNAAKTQMEKMVLEKLKTKGELVGVWKEPELHELVKKEGYAEKMLEVFGKAVMEMADADGGEKKKGDAKGIEADGVLMEW